MNFTNIDRLILAGLTGVSFIIFFYTFYLKIRLVTSGKPEYRFDRIPKRLWRTISQVLGQSKVLTERPFLGLAHAFILWGFIVFIIATLEQFFEGFGSTLLGRGDFYSVFSIVLKVFAALELIAVIIIAVRRYIVKPSYLSYPFIDTGVVLLLIGFLMITYLFMGFHDPVIAKFMWWAHIVLILIFLALIPTYNLHKLMDPVNVFFKSFRLGKIRTLDLEDLNKEDFGLNTISDYTWKDNLDSLACILCGRCTENCPANISEKTLNPKDIIQDSKDALYAKDNKPLVGNYIEEKVIWQCTTCGLCEWICPTGNEHLSKIIGLRRYQVAESNFPKEAATVFNGIEKNYNPWNYGFHLKGEFITKNKLPFFTEDSDYLLFVGCFGTYDQSYQKSILAFIEILRRFNVNFGVLENEFCCGEPARKLGNDMLYQTVAEHNANTIKERGITRIITACPHCYQTLKYDYQDYGLNLNITHHTEFLKDLIDTEELSFKSNNNENFVYHDPCYLAKYNNIMKSPRALMKSVKVNYLEPERTKIKSYCCGGGGGRLFLEEPEGKRINHIRFDELVKISTNIVSACPYCHTMLNDAAADKEMAEKTNVLDIAEVVLEKIKMLR